MPPFQKYNWQILCDFVNKLGNDFLNGFFSKLTGYPSIESIEEPDIEKGLDCLKELKFIPKKSFIKKSSR
ncbi:hypothetical protein [Chryseobacterium taklimakanense]|uniref:Uncharacterized protein n=1 Tax=Chryseobacterium taklimakanense TaxID=536441 RepID=A0A3G8WY41_9FLAO|nr:hypothetical protein [Chryseobacterium taklimakanense]AZI20686.1 hypothetical protein EIH08_08155 [Chryseobacterium taklimakanense]